MSFTHVKYSGLLYYSIFSNILSFLLFIFSIIHLFYCSIFSIFSIIMSFLLFYLLYYYVFSIILSVLFYLFYYVYSIILIEPGSIGKTEKQARSEFGDDSVKIYRTRFTPLYHALTARKQATEMKLVCAGSDEKVVGLHMIGRGCDEMLQVQHYICNFCWHSNLRCHLTIRHHMKYP